MRRLAAAFSIALGLAPAAALAGTVALGYGQIVQGESGRGEKEVDSIDLSTVIEHVEFLLAHDYRFSGLSDRSGISSDSARVAVATFDDVPSFQDLVLPMVQLWEIPVVVTVPTSGPPNEALLARLRSLAGSPWVDLVPRVDEFVPAGSRRGPDCGTVSVGDAEKIEERILSELASRLNETLEMLESLRADSAIRAVVWNPGSLYGPAVSVTKRMGLELQVTSHARGEGPRGSLDGVLARALVDSDDGVWALVQAALEWDPEAHPVRFAEVEGSWLCRGGGPAERIARVEEVAERLGLNGVRVEPVVEGNAWFSTRVLPVGGTVVGALTSRLRQDEGVRWILVDFPTLGEESRDLTLASDLARAVDLDVAILPRVPWGGRIREAVLFFRPGARIAWADPDEPARFDFDWSPRSEVGFGRTVFGDTAAVLDERILEASSRGIAWLGVSVAVLDRILSRGEEPKELHLPRATIPPETAPSPEPSSRPRERRGEGGSR